MSIDPHASVDPRALRQTLAQFVTGVTVIAIGANGGVHAMTANSFTSLSLDPPLVLFCASRDSKIGQLARVGLSFSVNVLRQEQRDLSTYFAGAWKEGAPPAFSFSQWELDRHAPAPRLEGNAAALACTVASMHEGGDHWIVVGEVVAVDRPADLAEPLVFHRGRYASLAR